MKILKSPQDRFPYMFSGEHLSLSIAKGWKPIFEKTCEDVDALLGDDKRKFHWTQLKEKFGSARFHWSMTDEGTPADLQKKIAALVNAAQAKTQHMCIVCGQPGLPDRSEPYVLVLCDEHIRQRADNKLPDFWCEGYK